MNRRHFTKLGLLSLAGGAITWPASAVNADTMKPLNAAAYSKERKFIPTQLGKIAYIERGHGKAALFLHGFPLNSFQWRGALERLAPFRRCIAPDFLGLGYTQPADDQTCSPLAQVEMLDALMRAMGLRQVDLVANDSGGAVAQLFLARYPERVRSLLLTNCDVETDSPPAALLPVIDLAREGMFVDKWLAPWLADKALARSAEGIGGMTYSNPSHPTDEAIEYYLGPLVKSPGQKAFVHNYAMALAPNPLAGIEASLRKYTGPVKVVWGLADTIFSQDSPKYLSRLFPNFHGIHGIKNAKLFFPEEYPDIIAREAQALWGHG